MNLGELIREFRSRTGDRRSAKYRFSDELVTGFANEAETEAAIRAKLLYDNLNQVTTAGLSIYALDDGIFSIDSAIITDPMGNKHEIKIKTRTELNNECSQWRTWTNTRPRFLIPDEDQYELSPTPDDAYTLTLYFYRTPLNKMRTDSSMPEITSRHHDGLVDWMVRQAMQIKDIDASDLKLAPDAEAKFIARFGIRPDANVLRKQAQKGAHRTKPIRF